MALSELERQRQENIKRNKELLRKLQLDSFTNDISKEVAKPEPKKRKPATERKPRKREASPAQPVRKLRRLAGVKTENSEEYARLQAEQEEEERKRKEMEKLRHTRLFGDFKLVDLITDKKGNVKEEADVDDDDRERLQQILDRLGDRISAGDFYSEIRDSKMLDDKDIDKKRKEFDKLHIYQKFDPLSIKITPNRVLLMAFHPLTSDRLVIAGDTTGCVGIWSVDHTSEVKSKDDVAEVQPAITTFKPHGKLVLKIVVLETNPLDVYTASYDGLIRKFDLHKQKLMDVAYIYDPWEDSPEDWPLGVLDINWCHDNPHVLYLTTLEGNFYRFDTRQKFDLKANQLLRCHDKKIGLFAVNPRVGHQIATASLDRLMRVWDLRNVSTSLWLAFDDQKAPHLYGGFTLRLLVLCVDWNHDNRLVFNGYDDKIHLAHLDGANKWLKTYTIDNGNPNPKTEEDLPLDTIKPYQTIRHNCQTGRWVLILKLKWQQRPADGVEKFIIANMNRGLDIYDQQGRILAHLDEDVGAVPAVCTMHPTQNWAVGGSANGKVYFFE